MPREYPTKTALALGALAAALAGAATATEFECEQPGDKRFLRVDLPGERHLCEVSVTAGLGSERRVLWYADNSTAFCFERLDDLVGRYVEEFGFECRAWPDREGVGGLSARQRTIVELELKEAIARGDDVADGTTAARTATAAADDPSVESEIAEEEGLPPRLAIEAIRAVASRTEEDEPAMLALQLFRSDGSDLVRVIADEGGRRRLVAGVERLVDWVSPIEGVRVLDAVVESVADDGTVEVVTRLAPAGGEGTLCSGRQALQASADEGLVARTPHRHVCTASPVASGGAG